MPRNTRASAAGEISPAALQWGRGKDTPEHLERGERFERFCRVLQ